MLDSISSMISIVFMLITLISFLYIPFYNKKYIKVFVIVIMFFSIAMIFVPNNIIGKIPFIGGNVENFIHDFLNMTQQFKDINELSPSIEVNVIKLIEKIIKLFTIFIIDGFAILVSIIVLLISHIVKKKGKTWKIIPSAFLTSCLCFVMILTPLYSIFNINKKMNDNLTANGKFYETYPEYKKYKVIFDLLNKGSSVITEDNQNILDKTYYLSSLFSSGADERIARDLSAITPLLNQLEDSGITIIYTDENFDFSQTTKTTFDFKEITSLISNVLKTEIFEDVARGFTNQILAVFEECIKEDTKTTEEVSLTLSSREFKEQYVGIIKMLNFVVKFDLIDKVQNLSFTKLVNIVKDLKLTGMTTLLTEIVAHPLVTKIKYYTNELTGIQAAIYACIKLYDVLNAWLSEYRNTSLYNTSKTFLELRGII